MRILMMAGVKIHSDKRAMSAHNLEKEKRETTTYIGTSKGASSTYSWARQFRDFQQTSKLFVEDLNVATSDCANEVDT